jgi:DNA replication protein DnaC
MRDQLQSLLAKLRFYGMASALNVELARAERDAVPPAELLHRLLTAEAASRRERCLAYRLDQAHLPWQWTLETSPFERQPGVNKAQINTSNSHYAVQRWVGGVGSVWTAWRAGAAE